MNKNRYRIIFSKAKNMFVAVAENIKSQSKVTGQSTHSLSITELADSKSFHQLWQVKSIVASMSLFMAFSPVYAQIQADPNATASQRAIIGVGQNQQGQNVPVVNIQTPKNGVSHNVYNQFDVLQPGVVLNNSRNGAGSVIVGQVGANPYLQTGEARVILNEVNSAAASRFEGNLEVAGQRADVIIANPSGINIQGGGFINANKTIFTTGKPQLNEDGSIKQFVVEQGKINVSSNGNNLGLGGSNNNADYVDIYAKAVELNAQVHANHALQVVTGSNTISDDLSSITPNQDNSTTPTFALDVKALGGMYANNIYIIGTDKGLGVNNAGITQASNNLVITSSGQIVNSGQISSTGKTEGLLSITTTETGIDGDIHTSGNISSNTLINIDSGNDLNINANQIILNNGGVASSPLLINTQGNLNLASNTRIMNDSSNADLYIDAANINLATNSEIRSNRGSANINIQNNLISAQNGGLVASYDLNIAAGNKQELTGSILQATVGTINLKAGSNNTKGLINIQDGTIWAGENLNLNSSGDIAIKNMGLVADNAVSKVQNINAYSDNNLTWEHTGTASPQISGKVQLDAANQLNLLNGTLSAKDDINLQANQLTLGTDLTSDKSINITSKVGDLTLNHALTANGDINASALTGSLTTGGLKAISNDGKLSLMAGKNVTLTHAGLTRSHLLAAQGINVASFGDGNVTSLSTDLYSSQGNILISSNLRNTLTDTTLNATKNIEVFAKDNLTLDGVITLGRAHTALSSKKNIYINSVVGEADAPIYTLAPQSQLNTNGILSLTAEKNINAQNLKATGGAILVEAGESFNTPQSIDLNATGNDFLRNDPKLISTDGGLTIQTNNALTLDPRVHKLNALGDIDIVSKNGALTLMGYTGTYGNGSEEVIKLITPSGGINLEGVQIELQGAQLEAKKNIKLVSNKGDISINGIKNTFNNYIVDKINEINNLSADKDSISTEISRLKTNEFNTDYKNLVAKYSKAYSTGFMAGYLIGTPEDVRLFDETYAQFIKKYPVLIQKKFEDGKPKPFSPVMSMPDPTGVMFIMVDAPLESNFDFRYNDGDIQEIDNIIKFYQSTLSGSEHNSSKLISDSGNINLISTKGITISGSKLTSKNGLVDIEAQGILEQPYTSTTVGINGISKTVDASIIVDGTRDFYDKGNENDENYSMRTLVNPTLISGLNGVNIRTTGKTAQDNLILQATGIVSQGGDVKIESYKNILFDAAVEQSYDRTTKTEKKKSWGGLKKKYITTRTENEDINAASVEIQAKNISIESKEASNPNNSIDIYSGKFNAEENISIRSGGNINFYTAEESSSSNEDITKKSSFAGIKYNSSKTNSTRSQVSQIPATLKADYIGVKSDFDTRLIGTEFEYLKGATIESGGTTFIQPAITNITETLKKEKNSVVWQSMQDKGSITETAKLPSFNGPTAPTINAAGGISVQIPIGEKDQNKVILRDEILKLANQPGNQYLKDLVNRNDVDWNSIILAQKDWDYKSQGLTGAGAALIVIIVTVLTYGAGTSAATAVTAATNSATLGAGAQAAVTTLASQASVSLVNNGGDLGKTLKDLGSKESVKGLVTSVVTAGLLNQVGTALNLQPDSALLSDRVINNFTNSVSSTLVQTAINGGNLEDNLKVALLAGFAGTLQGEMAQNIKGLEEVNYIAHKMAHALAGCIAGAIQKQCEAGAIGASIGEVIASFYDREPVGANIAELQKLEKKIETTSKLVSGVVAAYAGYDVNTAANSASIAIQNNSNSEIRLEIETQEAFLEGLSPQERTEWEIEFKKAGLKLGELALFLSNFIPAGRNANQARGIALPLFKTWFQNRKIIQTFSKGGISYRVNLPEHIAKFERLKGTTVSGAHNKLEFEALQQTKNIKVVSTKPTQTKGIYEIEYQVPAYHPQQPGVITGYKRVETKTVYDPKVFTDNQIVDMSQKAAALGYKEAVNLYKRSNGRMNQYESTYNGIKFRSYIAKNDNGQLFISNVHVVK
ncbi:DUF637 domain-containing protein [uncultured Acinetobacter sp.]|uniref:two-partner secretion domain-containing protein n=1 Tax=uncultured Acinetobacter sp. TaxID=165433 RepID=UPI00258AC93E|nr:DUF637 domain-containing protein [uncultured Acinetobacter sp.]